MHNLLDEIFRRLTFEVQDLSKWFGDGIARPGPRPCLGAPVQYDINPVYKAGTTGAGQSIAIISSSNVDLSLVKAYQSLFGLTANLPQVVVDGVDPGENDAATEAYLDIEAANSVAPGATILLYTSEGTALTDGLALAAMRAVEDDDMKYHDFLVNRITNPGSGDGHWLWHRCGCE